MKINRAHEAKENIDRKKKTEYKHDHQIIRRKES